MIFPVKVLGVQAVMLPAEKSDVVDGRPAGGIDVIVFELPA